MNHKHGLDASSGRTANFDDDKVPDVDEMTPELQGVVNVTQLVDVALSATWRSRRDVGEGVLTRSARNCSATTIAKSTWERGTRPEYLSMTSVPRDTLVIIMNITPCACGTRLVAWSYPQGLGTIMEYKISIMSDHKQGRG